MPQSNGQDGFSLIELLVVMLLIGIAIGIAAPLIRPAKFQMDAAVVLVASTLNAQQRDAVLRQHDVVLALDTANRTIRIHHDEDNDGAVDSGERTSIVQLDEGAAFGRGTAPARPLGSGTTSLTGTQGGLPALTFRRNGSASEEAIIYLTSGQALASGASTFADHTRAIEIERATGRVRCYSYATETWVQTC